MKHSATISWQNKMTFEANVDGHKLIMDTIPEIGGSMSGPRPKPLLLAALAGCTGMDVVPILQKMKVNFDGLTIYVEAEVADEHPKIYKTITVIYEFTGNDLPVDKLEKAINLSKEKYCAVSAMLGKSAILNHEIRIKKNN